MNTQNSLTTRLPEFITKLYPWGHGHQIKGFVAFVGALLEAKSCSQAKLAETFENKQAAVKRLSRFLHNPRLRTKDLAEGVATEFVAQVARHAFVRIALDWTVENGLHTLVASAIVGRRAVPIYWRAYEEGTFKGPRSQIERAFVERLIKVVLCDIPRGKVVFTADRGFADVRLFDLLDSLRIAFVIRTKDNVKIFWPGRWRKLGTLKLLTQYAATQSGARPLLRRVAAVLLHNAEPRAIGKANGAFGSGCRTATTRRSKPKRNTNGVGVANAVSATPNTCWV